MTLLRIAVGWHFLYEGLWKIDSDKGAASYATSWYTLQSSVGRLGCDLEGMDLPPALARADAWYDEVVRAFKARNNPLADDQKARLADLRDKVKLAAAARGEEIVNAMRQRVAADASCTTAPFSEERLAADRKSLDAIAGELLALIGEPLVELAVQAQSIATVEQLGAGPVTRPGEPAGWIDAVMEWGLVAIGAGLLLGLFTPIAALAAAGQLAMFYMASPPWPGLPAATLGGHYLFVDRNLIELVAALAFAATGTGKWAGLDGLVPRLRARHVEVCDDTERATTASR